MLRDRDGVSVEEARRGWRALRRRCWTGSATFVELHVEQGRDLVDRRRRRSAWPARSGRTGATASTSRGEANHAGSTRMEDRADPMLTYAMTALAANKQARLAGERATFGRVEVTPNGTNAVPSQVLAWLDARCSSEAALAELVETVDAAGHRARRRATGRRWSVTPESVSGGGRVRPALACAARRDHAATGRSSRPRPATTPASSRPPASRPRCSSSATRPASRTRRPRPPSMADCLAGVHALADTLAELTGEPA